MSRLGRHIRSTVSKNNILQSLNYKGGFAPPIRGVEIFLLCFGLNMKHYTKI